MSDLSKALEWAEWRTGETAETLCGQLRGFGATDAEAMRDAVESGRTVWHAEEGATWAEITSDAKSAGILTFVKTPYGVLVVDDTD